MSTPDSELSAAERAALAGLEAAATADDPHLAARLRGSTATRVRSVAPRVVPAVAVACVRVLGIRWWGLAVVVAGVALMVLGLGAGLAISVAGVAVTIVGLRVVAEAVSARFAARPGRHPGRRSPAGL